MEITKWNDVDATRKRIYFVSHLPCHIFNASRPFLRFSFSFVVRLPVAARRNAARISLENSGVIGSLGEFTPNIVCNFMVQR